MRVWRIPYSTNVERVAIAAGVSGVPVEWVDVSAYEDDYEIHHLMRRYQSLDGRPRVAAWLDRVSALPQA